MGDMNTALGQDLPRSEDVRHDGLDLRAPAVPIAEPHESSGQDGPKRADEDVSASRDSDARDNAARHDNQSPTKIRNSSNVDRPVSTEPSKDSLWEQGRDLIPSEEDSNVAVDQDRLGRTLDSMKKFLSRHEGSQNCLVCNSMEDVLVSGELDVDRLKNSFEAATQSEKETAIKNHVPPPDPRMRFRLGRSSIEKVEFVLEKREHWSAIRLQEFRRDEKALRVGPRRPLLSTSQDLPDLSGDSPAVTEEPGDQSRPALSPLLDSERSLEVAPETALRKDYRQHAKDVCVFVPFQQGKHGFAREVADHVDVEVIRLWLSRCENRHNLCSQRIGDSYPPGLILIDAVKMCLVPVASHSPVRYIALSYVWGYVAQPTLKKEVLETWMCDGQLRDVEVPQTIRDAIQLAQMIGYRYIWVDALCIVQDDAASRHGQISQMHEIYRHADMTIVAADG